MALKESPDRPSQLLAIHLYATFTSVTTNLVDMGQRSFSCHCDITRKAAEETFSRSSVEMKTAEKTCTGVTSMCAATHFLECSPADASLLPGNERG